MLFHLSCIAHMLGSKASIDHLLAIAICKLFISFWHTWISILKISHIWTHYITPTHSFIPFSLFSISILCPTKMKIFMSSFPYKNQLSGLTKKEKMEVVVKNSIGI